MPGTGTGGRVNIESDMEILTIGHSTRTIDEFVDLLHMHGVELLVDIRTVPKSRHNPQYNTDVLPNSLGDANIEYVHMKGLGGFRKPQPNSVNSAWNVESFRGFADYMLSNDFEDNLNRLIDLAREKCVALMCAEAVPWRCHRSLISDALVARGVRVWHILGKTRTSEHHLTAWARVKDGRVFYPAEDEATEHLHKAGS